MIARVVLSPEAEDDVINVYIRGIMKFGLSQADRYEAMLRQAIDDDLANFPNMGIARPELGPNIRSLYRGAHHIYYYVEGDTLKIARILPDRMNVEKDELVAALQKLGQSGSAGGVP